METYFRLLVVGVGCLVRHSHVREAQKVVRRKGSLALRCSCHDAIMASGEEARVPEQRDENEENICRAGGAAGRLVSLCGRRPRGGTGARHVPLIDTLNEDVIAKIVTEKRAYIKSLPDSSSDENLASQCALIFIAPRRR